MAKDNFINRFLANTADVLQNQQVGTTQGQLDARDDRRRKIEAEKAEAEQKSRMFDPNSEESKRAQSIAGMIPGIGERLGDRLSQLSADDLEQLLPNLSKALDRSAKQDAAKLDREFQASEAEKARQGRLELEQTRQQGAQQLEAQRAANKQAAAPSAPALSVGEKEIDKQFAKEFSKFTTGGGFASVSANLDKLRGAVGDLRSGENLTGGITSLLPKGARDLVAPRRSAVEDNVRNVVQQSLKAILGGQFSEKEGERVINATFNPRLDEAVIADRVEALAQQLEAAAQVKQAQAEYFQQNGTLKGFNVPLPQIGVFTKKKDGSEITPQDIDNMSLEELKDAGLI